jgi:DNA-binding PadR family transcriptional regulator
MISTGTKRGSAELALLALLADQPLHGYELARRIEEQSGGALRFTLASLYPLLYRMENRGWVRGAWQTLPNGRRRRCYLLTPQGRKQLAPMRKEWEMFFRALHKLAGVGRA